MAADQLPGAEVASTPGRTRPDSPHDPSSLVRTDELPAVDVPRPEATPDEAGHLHGPTTAPADLRRRRRRARSRGILIGVAAFVAVVVGYYLVSLFQVWDTGRTDQARPVDAIVVMGAAQYDGRPSPQLAARLDHVVELWPEGHAELVVVTGGKLPDDRFTEAEASRAYLVDRGVPEAAIVLENSGSSTLESLQGVAVLLEDRGLDRVLIVTDPYHSLRSRLVAEEVGLTAYTSPTPTSVVTGGASFRRHVQEAAGVALGRVLGFERLSGLIG